VQGMVRAAGPAALWRGLGPTLWRDVPFSALYWFGYEQLRRALAARAPYDHGSDAYWPRFAQSFYAGAIAGAVRRQPRPGAA
jgi:solute carrier family 25, member 39/40